MTARILVSRNKREGGYVGWHRSVYGGKRHTRAGRQKGYSLREFYRWV